MATTKNIHISNATPADAQLIADQNLLAIIFRNLLQNAIKFTHPGGRIELSYGHTNGYQQFCMVDAGIGMSQTQFDRLFSLTKHRSQAGTAQETGTGLGLILVKELAEANGGKSGGAVRWARASPSPWRSGLDRINHKAIDN